MIQNFSYCRRLNKVKGAEIEKGKGRAAEPRCLPWVPLLIIIFTTTEPNSIQEPRPYTYYTG
jgi:hypothetical protein